ncbi:hypothetical protein B0I35DRAFT_408741 [Stachybotrys elegans]|uniref:Clr5 domain-containing protein n=1 Tax=Stachybotrys elegans TaxID=80388 RepID=A0A8K0WSN2_9HYPO|nr:hypothetical protein B0I35DRAFT_408741 [Stachybotrys elegans]
MAVLTKYAVLSSSSSSCLSASVMVYDWEAHQQTCYQLYIKEGRSLEEIMDHMKRVHSFTPSKRAYQVQFRNWKFPSKHKPAYKNEPLVARIRELWEQNMGQPEMLQVLGQEGYQIKPRELMRVRSMNRLLLRAANQHKPGPEDHETSSLDEESVLTTLSEDGTGPDEYASLAEGLGTPENLTGASQTASLNETRPAKKRRGRLVQATDGSSTVVRFPSEMPLEEARVTLGLTPTEYRGVRSVFASICQEEGVTKKTLVGPDRWEAIKKRLIGGNQQLQAALWKSRDDAETKKLALDIICTEVTKRMRSNGARMTLAQTKNILGFNPEETRMVRAAFTNVLRDARFTYKSSATPEQWEQLKYKWAEQCELVRNMNSETTDEEAQKKARALELLARDVVKRIRDEKLSKRKRNDMEKLDDAQDQGPADFAEAGFVTKPTEPASSLAHEAELDDDLVSSNFDDISEASEPHEMSFAPTSTPMAAHLPMALQGQPPGMSGHPSQLSQASRIIGSSLPGAMPLDAHVGSSLMLGAGSGVGFMDATYTHPQYTAAPGQAGVFSSVTTVPAGFAAYLRLHPSSRVVSDTSLWIATLNLPSVQELRQTAVQNYPGAVCLRIEGIVKDGKGGEIPLPIEQDQELSAYLAHLQGAAPTFNVQLWKT